MHAPAVNIVAWELHKYHSVGTIQKFAFSTSHITHGLHRHCMGKRWTHAYRQDRACNQALTHCYEPNWAQCMPSPMFRWFHLAQLLSSYLPVSSDTWLPTDTPDWWRSTDCLQNICTLSAYIRGCWLNLAYVINPNFPPWITTSHVRPYFNFKNSKVSKTLHRDLLPPYIPLLTH